MNSVLPQLDRLTQLAEAATQGTWQIDGHSHIEVGCRCLSCHDEPTVWHVSTMLACEEVPGEGDRCEQVGFSYADAAFIEAANPAVVLWLIERIRGLEAPARPRPMHNHVTREVRAPGVCPGCDASRTTPVDADPT